MKSGGEAQGEERFPHEFAPEAAEAPQESPHWMNWPEDDSWIEWLLKEAPGGEPHELPPEAERHDEVTLRRDVSGVSFRIRGFFDGAALGSAAWLIDKILPAQGVSMIFAPSGMGKTWVVDDWSVRVAAGRPWLDHPVMTGSVLYIAAEGAFTIPARTYAAKTNLGITACLPIFTVSESIVFNDDGAHVTILADMLREEFARRRLPPIALVVIDTYTACVQGSVNDDDVASAFMRGLRRFLRRLAPAEAPSPAGLIVHHPGLADAERPRGSSAFPADVDCGMLLEEAKAFEDSQPGDPSQPQERTLILRCTKMRQGETFPDVAFTLRHVTPTDDAGEPIDLGGETLTALVVQPAPGEVVRKSKREERSEQRRARNTRALKALEQAKHPLQSEDWRRWSEVSSKGGWETTRDELVSTGKVIVIPPPTDKKRPTYALSPSGGMPHGAGEKPKP